MPARKQQETVPRGEKDHGKTLDHCWLRSLIILAILRWWPLPPVSRCLREGQEETLTSVPSLQEGQDDVTEDGMSRATSYNLSAPFRHWKDESHTCKSLPDTGILVTAGQSSPQPSLWPAVNPEALRNEKTFRKPPSTVPATSALPPEMGWIMSPKFLSTWNISIWAYLETGSLQM